MNLGEERDTRAFLDTSIYFESRFKPHQINSMYFTCVNAIPKGQRNGALENGKIES